MIDGEAIIHHNLRTNRACYRNGFSIENPKLHPNHLGADRDSLSSNRVHPFAAVENEDYLKLFGDGYKIRIGGFA